MRALLFIVLSISCGLPQATEIFSGEELFKRPYFTHPQISPDGNFIAGRTDDGEKRELVVTDVKSGERYPLVFFAKNNYLRNFHWIDSQTIYVEYRHRKKDKKSIVRLNLEDLSQKPKPLQISANGYLLSSLPETEDEVLFARPVNKRDIAIYQIKTQDLLELKFSNAKKMRSHLDSARYYLYDENSTGFFGFTSDDEGKVVQVWFLAPNQNTWRLLHSTEKADILVPRDSIS